MQNSLVKNTKMSTMIINRCRKKSIFEKYVSIIEIEICTLWHHKDPRIQTTETEHAEKDWVSLQI